MDVVDQLFMAGKFDPHDDSIPSLEQLLGIPRDDLQKQRKKAKGKENTCVNSMDLSVFVITCSSEEVIHRAEGGNQKEEI